jgi:hypothetical protein
VLGWSVEVGVITRAVTAFPVTVFVVT